MKVQIKSIREAKSLKEWFSEKDFRAMSPEEQQEYLAQHPNSKFQPDNNTGEDGDSKNDNESNKTDNVVPSELKADNYSPTRTTVKKALSYLKSNFDKEFFVNQDNYGYQYFQMGLGGITGQKGDLISIFPPKKRPYDDKDYPYWTIEYRYDSKYNDGDYHGDEDKQTLKSLDDVKKYFDKYVKDFNDTEEKKNKEKQDKITTIDKNKKYVDKSIFDKDTQDKLLKSAESTIGEIDGAKPEFSSAGYTVITRDDGSTDSSPMNGDSIFWQNDDMSVDIGIEMAQSYDNKNKIVYYVYGEYNGKELDKEFNTYEKALDYVKKITKK